MRTALPVSVLAFAASLACSLVAQAQQGPGSAAPAAAPPSWQQGRNPEQDASPLHPFAPHMTGRAAKELPLDKLKVPAGFKVEVWAEGIPEARSLALGDKGTVFVSNRLSKNVYAVVDRNGQRQVKTLLKGLDAPNGIAFSKGTLYVAERGRITRYDGIEANLDNAPEAKVVIDGLDPTRQPGHFWKYLVMGPDGKLYFNIGAPGNIVMPSYMQASVMRVDPKSGVLETVALGVRNSVGMDFDPKSKDLWFTNHGRDWLSDDTPNDTLHRVAVKNKVIPNFGYPFCHQGDIVDPEFGKNRSCAEFAKPVAKLGAHIAPLGMKFYSGKMFPTEYRNNMFIAMHGSWNRTTKQGYNVMRGTVGENGKVKLQPFLTGFLTDEKADPPMWGRPVDVLQMRDGSLLVSDDYNGVLYRVSYAKK
ncbi:MAG TPA: PQQ-dependent sugar dehydrogenase [Burkholderiales bacterium]|nr:PQQ-dependent sugar dehydrogenase [Burkholderiales bacterium]